MSKSVRFHLSSLVSVQSAANHPEVFGHAGRVGLEQRLSETKIAESSRTGFEEDQIGPLLRLEERQEMEIPAADKNRIFLLSILALRE